MDSSRIGNSYVPLPKKLPVKDDRSSPSGDEGRSNRGGRQRPKIIHGPHPEDERAYPVVETPGGNPSPRRRDASSNPSPRRDSGVFSMDGSPRARQYHDEFGRPAFPPSHLQGHREGAHEASERLHEALMKERHERLEAERAALRAKEETNEVKAELERVKRQSWLQDRERQVADREKQFHEEQRRIAEAPPSRPTREVVVTQPKPPVRFVDDATDALNRARDDHKRKSGGRGGGFI
jgi:hypothetical protein